MLKGNYPQDNFTTPNKVVNNTNAGIGIYKNVYTYICICVIDNNLMVFKVDFNSTNIIIKMQIIMGQNANYINFIALKR